MKLHNATIAEVCECFRCGFITAVEAKEILEQRDKNIEASWLLGIDIGDVELLDQSPAQATMKRRLDEAEQRRSQGLKA